MAVIHDERERKEEKKRKIILIGTALVIVAAIIGAYFLLAKLARDKIDTKTAVKAIKVLEKTDISTIEEEIAQLEEIGRQSDENDANRTPQEKMEGTVVLGDSITQGLTEFGILDGSMVIAEKGVHLSQLDEVIEKAVGLNPNCVFLAYGMNDLEGMQGDAEKFVKQYKVLLDTLREKLPNAKIYVNSILPMQQKHIDVVPVDGNVPAFNEALAALCKEEAVTYIDNTDLVKDEYFEQDGIHMKKIYYPEWVNRMAEVAKL